MLETIFYSLTFSTTLKMEEWVLLTAPSFIFSIVVFRNFKYLTAERKKMYGCWKYLKTLEFCLLFYFFEKCHSGRYNYEFSSFATSNVCQAINTVKLIMLRNNTRFRKTQLNSVPLHCDMQRFFPPFKTCFNSPRLTHFK